MLHMAYSIYLWQARLAGLKEVLLVYAMCQQFLEQLIEGDELYTKVGFVAQIKDK